MIPNPIGASPSAVVSPSGRQAAETTSAQQSPPLALVNVANAEFAQLPANRSQEGAGAPPWQPSEDAVDHFNSLPPEMREKIWNSLDAAGFSNMVETSRGLADEVVAAFKRLPEATKSVLWLKARTENQLGGVQFLIDNGIDVDACDANGETPLFNAANTGQIEVAKLLVGVGMDGARVTTADGLPGGSRLLLSVAGGGDPWLGKNLILAGANVNTLNKYGESVLWTAAQQMGDPDTVKTLIEAGADINAANPHGGSTPLQMAVERGHNQIVAMLLKCPGILIRAPDHNGVTPLGRAQRYAMYDQGFPNIFESFKSYMAERTHPEHRSWIKAAAAGDMGAMRHLLSTHGDSIVNSVGEGSRTALWYAAGNGRKEAVEALITWGADPKWHDGDGDTPLSQAAGRGHSGVVNVLLDHGADLNLTNECGDTPMTRAFVYGHVDTAKNLLNRGTDPNLFRADSESPLYKAAFRGHAEMVTALLKKGGDPNGTGDVGRARVTVLDLAVRHRHLEIVEILLKAGADPNRSAEDGVTPWSRAQQYGSAAILAAFDKYAKGSSSGSQG